MSEPGFYQLCWIQKPGTFLACDRKLDHLGPHSWATATEASNGEQHELTLCRACYCITKSLRIKPKKSGGYRWGYAEPGSIPPVFYCGKCGADNPAEPTALEQFKQEVRSHLSYEAERVHAAYLIHQLEEENSPEMDRLVEVAAQAAQSYARQQVEEARQEQKQADALRFERAIGKDETGSIGWGIPGEKLVLSQHEKERNSLRTEARTRYYSEQE